MELNNISFFSDAQFQSESRDFLTQSQRFDEFQRTLGNIARTLHSYHTELK